MFLDLGLSEIFFKKCSSELSGIYEVKTVYLGFTRF